MIGFQHQVKFPAMILACVCGAGALADGDVAITITNDNTDDVVVSVYDMNTTPKSKLLSQQRISGFASIPMSVTSGDDGTAHIFWRAVTASSDPRQCGEKDRPGLATGASVHVYAKSDCPTH
jgi:hypothetical protein